jgi:hypothetical protein
VKQPVAKYDGWFRDSQSGSFDCSNKSEYEKYMIAHKARIKKEEEHKALQKDVSDLKSEMSDIKSLLLTLVQNREKHYDD